MPPKKKDKAAEHAKHFANRFSDRVQKFASDARGGKYDAARLASDLANSVIDTIDLWGNFLGYGASPQVGLADFQDHPSADWKNGLDTMVTVASEVPTTGITWPANGALNATALKLRPVDGGAAVNLQLTQVKVDEDGYQLTVSVKDLSPGAGSVAAGEYLGTLYYTDSASVNVFVAVIRGIVT